MEEIQKITISGFRGVNTPPLELDFKKGHSLQSMMIYGRNGSGKSSIVDAWEWLCSGNIEYLAREGAGPQAYPHKEASEGQTYIEVKFKDDEIGRIKVEYDFNKITQPKIEGNLSKLRERIPHPCHLRYRDLTEFVYRQKAEKYEILSRFMGFANAVDIQNDLQTCSGRLEKKLKDLQIDRNELAEEYQELSGKKLKDNMSFLKNVNIILNRQNIAPAEKLVELNIRIKKLKELVAKDKKGQKLSLLIDIQKIIDRFYPVEDIRSNISEFQKDLREFKRDEKEISKLILFDLYEKGIKAIEFLKIYDKCPLCDKPYEGNLIDHINSKKCILNELSERRTELDSKRKSSFSSIDTIIRKIEIASPYLEGKEQELPDYLLQYQKNLIDVKSMIKECKDILEIKIEDTDKEFDFIKKINTKEYKFILESEDKIKKKILKQIKILEKDKSRKQLIDDFQLAINLQKKFENWVQLNKKIKMLEEIKDSYEKIRSNYVKETKKGVQASFDAISFEVAKYFNTLEKDSKVIADPKIKLISEKDKAVELEIIFSGDPISPAYKILSESQLNSFGLSIFLASIKNFNTNFKFIILDDVINSFDAYKRPRVIDLLKEYFSDYQVLLLTHDSIWLDRLQRSFPQWTRKHFYGWDYTLGPRVEPGKNSYEKIEEFLSKDNPAEAGRTFGVYLEWILQLLCENLEAFVKYNRENEYTLFELFQAFKGRIKQKLKENHLVVKLILDFEMDEGFRNFCAHWKEPEIPYSSPEIKEIVKKWKKIESEIECNECNKFIKYEKVDGHEHISCPCRELNLKGNESRKGGQASQVHKM